jgi:bacterioferritin (cytochrome b1)
MCNSNSKATLRTKKMPYTNSAMNICAEALDNGSCDLFQSTLNDEEGHADFLEAQLHAIKENGNQHLPRAAVAWREVAKSIHAV